MSNEIKLSIKCKYLCGEMLNHSRRKLLDLGDLELQQQQSTEELLRLDALLLGTRDRMANALRDWRFRFDLFTN